MKRAALFRILVLAAALVWPVVAPAADFTVTNTDDSGAGSLRQAIIEANAADCSGQDPQRIRFDIPGTGVHTIRPLTPLPVFLNSIAIDGYTQPGSQKTTSPEGINALLTIELDGSLAGNSHGLVVGTDPTQACNGRRSAISGLVINRFAGAGIRIGGCATEPVGGNSACFVYQVDVWGNFLGTDTSGTLALGNGRGVEIGVSVQDTTIGGNVAEYRNLISGNLGDGVRVVLESPKNPVSDLVVRGNYIGLDASGLLALGNGGHGIVADLGAMTVQENWIAASGGDGVNLTSTGTYYENGWADVVANKIGVGIHEEALGNHGDGVRVDGRTIAAVYGWSPGQGAPSIIANNGGAGVFVAAPANAAGTSWPHVLARQARMYGNGGLGIDIAPAGVNPIRDDGDLLGPNENLNAPVLVSALAAGPVSPTGNAPVTVSGSLHTIAQAVVEVYFYVNTACDPSGYGEAEYVLAGYPSLWHSQGTTDASGDFAFDAQFNAPVGSFITANTVRLTSDSSSPNSIASELSNCMRVQGPDRIFADGFDPSA